MGIFLGWVLFSGLLGLVATSFNRSGIGYFLLSLLLSPLLALIILLVAGKHEESETGMSTGGDAIKCGECGAVNSLPATYCSSCGKELGT